MHHTRLPAVQEEEETGSDSDDYSIAESGDGDAVDSADSGEVAAPFEDTHPTRASTAEKGKGVDRSGPQRPTTRPRSSSLVKEKESRTWADLEWSMVIALISPIGNWLTGSDHVKNLFLLLLLIFYLHQLIEVPWRLYHSSRPRSRKHAMEPVKDARAEFASSELRVRELFFLSCTVLSPFLGAVLVRHVFSALEGVDSLSWFSTTLFVLATGIRPWTHLVSRLQERTDDLQQALYAEEEEEYHRGVDQKLESVMDRLAELERALRDVKAKADRVAPLEEACDEIGDGLETLERTVHRQERKIESARVSHNNRLSAVESTVLRLEEQQKQHLRVIAVHAQATRDSVHIALPPFLSQFLVHLRNQLSQIMHIIAKRYPSFLLKQQVKPLSTTMISAPVTPSGTVHFFNGTPLETIPEAADSDSEGTYVSDKEGTSHTSPGAGELHKRGGRKRSRSRSHSGARMLHRQKSYGRLALDYASDVFSWPYRFAVKTLLFVLPPQAQKQFL